MENLDTKSLLLDMSNNLSRAGKYGLSGNIKRTKQFLAETRKYLSEVKSRKLPLRTKRTLDQFELVLDQLESKEEFDKYAADDSYTYSSILMHKAMTF